MAGATAVTVTGSLVTSRPTTPTGFFHKRIFSTGLSIPTGNVSGSVHAQSLRAVTPGDARFTPIICRASRSAYSPLNSRPNSGDRPPADIGPLFPGCDYEHWLIVMDKPGGENATKQQMIDCYVQTLAKVVGR